MVDAPDDADRGSESSANEFDLERAYDREELAAVLGEFATAFETGRPIRLRGDGRTVRIDLPQRLTAAFEAERDPTLEPPVAELELEFAWDEAGDSSVRTTDDSAGESAERTETRDTTDETDDADAAPAAAVMPLEGVTERSESPADDETAETTVTVQETDSGVADRTSESDRTSRFEVYEDNADEWRWRLVHWNGNILADSGEGYVSRSNAERAVRGVMRSASTATIVRRN
ncbi:amphi-Trp domain-containing protein [Natrinema halophilum]|uniref:DUF1508 domain-containing protein n=1 Tax=Natrinema halophilum TaxID=1699371 RepID=A0A7D5HAP2_9EURY|nr:amphi-Trp domain-containing protein [Natrinema halophilum]QLG50895.1 DUF1508 domain-containing protein [Natrinema halophilum]